MRLGAFIVTYNRPAILRETIRLILEQTRSPDLILIVDNGKAEDTESILQDFRHHQVLHHPLGENLGPAAAEAYGLGWLSRHMYDWIYWVDDDNPPQSADTVERLLEIVSGENHVDVAGIAAVGTLFDWTTGETKRLPDHCLNGVVEVDVFGGNSQLVLSREAIQAVGLPDRRLFIDFEDTEYCLRLRQAGFRLLVDGDLMREYRARAGRLYLKRQRVPQLRKCWRPWRRYYSTRNYIFAMNKTFHRPDLARREVLKACGRSILYWKYGLKRGATLSSLQLRGVLDGYLGRMGRTIPPQAKYGGDS